MQPNFYIIFSPTALEDFPSTFMTSFYLERDNKIFLNDLLRSFPTMTVLEVDAIIAQIKAIIEQVTMAIELVLALILISGGMVLLASIQASMDERFKQHAILRTLGRRSKTGYGQFDCRILRAWILCRPACHVWVRNYRLRLGDGNL